MIKPIKRKFKITRKDNFKIPSKGVIVSWKLLPSTSQLSELLSAIPPIIKIDNLKTFLIWLSDKDPLYFSLSSWRKQSRSILCPESEDEKQIVELDRIFFAEQLDIGNYYTQLTAKEKFNSIFTLRLDFSFEFHPNIATIIDEIEVEEYYYPRQTSNTDNSSNTNSSITLSTNISTN